MKKIFLIAIVFCCYYNLLAVTINPYLQTPTSTSIIVSWKSEDGLEQYIQYGTDSTLANTASGDYEMLDDGPLHTTWHSVKISDLSPNTTYFYKCITGSDESDIHSFHTQPEHGQDTGHIRFLVIGDNRTYPDDHRMVINGMVSKMTDFFGDDYNQDVNLLINVGDVVTNGWNLSEYNNEYFIPMIPISSKIPTMVSIGNHESEADLYYQFMKYENLNNAISEENKEVYYNFQIGRVLFIGINSNYQYHNETQLNWLEEVLDNAQQDDSIDWIFAFCHHPGHSEVWPDGNTAYIQHDVIPLLEKHSKAEFLIYGHSHNYERGALTEGNLRLMLSGGGGGGLDRWRMYNNQTNYIEIQKSYDHYCYSYFDIDVANKSYTCQTYSMGHKDLFQNNVLIDTFYRKQVGVDPPEKPIAISNNKSIELPFALEASEYSNTEQILSSQFQITTIEGDYSECMVDMKRDFEDYYSDIPSSNYTPIDLNEGVDLTKLFLTMDLLAEPNDYFWRVRYRNRNLQWSEWSEENSITIINTGYVEIPQHNKSLSFDGSEYILLADSLDNAILPTKEITIEAWLKVRDNKQYGGILGAVQDNGSYEKGFVLWNNTSSLQFGLSTEGSDDGDGKMTYISGKNLVMNDIWYHIAVTYDGSTIKSYFNGIESDVSNAQSGNILYDPNSKFVVGAYRDKDEDFRLNGEIDELRLWNKCLDSDAIKKWLHKELDSTHENYENIVSYWSMNGDNISGNLMNDISNTGIMKSMNITNLRASEALIGYDGYVIDDQNTHIIGSENVNMSVNITSNPSYRHYLDVFQKYEDNFTFLNNEYFSSGIAKRYNVIWTIDEIGENNKRGESVVADLIFNYSGLLDKCSTDSLLILRKPATDSVWQNITDKFIKNDGSHTFTTTGMDTLTGEYSFGIMSNVTSLDNESNIPNTYYLKQNYPNPFNASTTIEYGVKENSQINITIYNTRGQIVENIINKIHVPGAYQVKWNCGDLSSGIYFIKMNADDRIIKINKSILLK